MTISNFAYTWAWPELIGVALHVSTEVLETFHQYRQTRQQCEHGGLLFVSLDDPRGLILARATPPHRADRSTRYSLELDPARCRHDITQANLQGLRLIGHWHTHPEPIPNPSTQDLESFRAFGVQHSSILSWPLAVIVGTTPSADGVGAWSIRSHTILQARRLNVKEACEGVRSAKE